MLSWFYEASWRHMPACWIFCKTRKDLGIAKDAVNPGITVGGDYMVVSDIHAHHELIMSWPMRWLGRPRPLVQAVDVAKALLLISSAHTHCSTAAFLHPAMPCVPFQQMSRYINSLANYTLVLSTVACELLLLVMPQAVHWSWHDGKLASEPRNLLHEVYPTGQSMALLNKAVRNRSLN